MGLSAIEQDAAIADSFNNGVSSLEDEKFSQASMRMFRIFTDQWGREYNADCERKTQHPCGPYAARYRAPLIPPAKYMVITDTIRARVVVDTHRWIADLLDEHDMYWREVHIWAKEKAGVKALDLYNRKESRVDPQLIPFVGVAPMPIEVIQAMRAGNRWILGLPLDNGQPAPKPKAAPREHFPDAETLRERDPFRENDPWAEEGGVTPPPPTKNTAEPETYPHRYAAKYWWLTSEHREDCIAGKRKPFAGTKVEAEAARAKGVLPALVEAPKIDPSWED